MAKVLAFPGSAMLLCLSDRAAVGATVRSDSCRSRCVPVLSARPRGRLLAGGHLLVVLPHDRLLRFLARISHRPPGLLASLDSARGARDRAEPRFFGASSASRGDL